MSNAFLASNGVPAWLDAWLFGWAQVGPLVATTQLVQATRQEVQISSGGGAFTVYFPSNMQVNDTIKLVDIGNQIPGNNVSLSPSALGYQIQNPNTLALQTGAYAWGSNEVAGSTITFQLVQDPTLGYYLKYLPGAGIAANTAQPSPVIVTGLTNAVPVGPTITVGNTTSAVAAQFGSGATNGEPKQFIAGKQGGSMFTISSTAPIMIGGVLQTAPPALAPSQGQSFIWLAGYTAPGAGSPGTWWG